MMIYAILLCLALSLNMRDRKMLALTALVGAGIFAPVPGPNFYLICILGETLIALCAYHIAAPASFPIINISILLVVFHGLGWVFNGYPQTSPYRVMVPLCEYGELLMCILLSNKFTKRGSHGHA